MKLLELLRFAWLWGYLLDTLKIILRINGCAAAALALINDITRHASSETAGKLLLEILRFPCLPFGGERERRERDRYIEREER